MSKIKFDKRNYRKHNERNKELINKSLKELGAGRSILLDRDDSLIAGNGVYEQAEKLGIPVRVIETDGSELIAVKRTDIGEYDEKRKRLALADNATSDSSEWDVDAITADLSPVEVLMWDVMLPEPSTTPLTSAEDEWEEIERKKAEFEAKMKAGELDEDDPEYQEFLAKFEAKKTTDDCYTPEPVYEAVADWVANQYGVSRANFVRPFYPNGDYQREKYKKTDIVVDNPPFSILTQIIDWYNARGIRFFMFAPYLTVIGSCAHRCTALPVGCDITYENGANVKTAFVTNMEDPRIRAKSAPTLYRNVQKANDQYRKSIRKNLPKYEYDKHIMTFLQFHQYSRYGMEFELREEESAVVGQLESQKQAKKAIFGKAYLISDNVLKQRSVNDQLKIERERDEQNRRAAEIPDVWPLQQKELDIIEILNRKEGKR